MGKESLVRGVFAAMAVGLAACATPSDGGEVVAEDPKASDDELSGLPYERPERCAEEAFQLLVGQRAVEVDADTLPQPHRIIGPDDAVTMDFRVDRLNVYYGDDGVVTEVRCG